MNVRGHRNAKAFLDLRKNGQCPPVADAGKAVDPGSVGLAVAALKNQRQVQCSAGFDQRFRDAKSHILPFDGTRASDDLESVACRPTGVLKVAFHGAKFVKR